MNNLRWLVRAAHWARNPPSDRRVMLVAVAVALCLGIVAAEHLGWWPEWATMERGRGHHRMPRP